jgi:hypothetical protein
MGYDAIGWIYNIFTFIFIYNLPQDILKVLHDFIFSKIALIYSLMT